MPWIKEVVRGFERRREYYTEVYQIENLSLKNEGVERIYDLLDGGAIIPPV
jgi:hypothetical protein